jgi:hypothetical protein
METKGNCKCMMMIGAWRKGDYGQKGKIVEQNDDESFHF